MIAVHSHCPICDEENVFAADDDFWSCRSSLRSDVCPYGKCVVRERALAHVLFSLWHKEMVMGLSVHEAAPTARGLSLWLKQNVQGYVRSGYWPDKGFGYVVNGVRNENLENQTFDDGIFDVVLHLDVLEHLFNPFQALRETYRTLKRGGYCIFSTPTEHNRFKSEQVAFLEEGSELRIVGKPEYHGNPQRPEDGALVTWRYGYDLPLRISRETDFDVEVRRWQSKSLGVMGYMTEVYVLKKEMGFV